MSILEPGRPAVDFEVAVRRGTTYWINIPGKVLQDVYDIAVNSMDFGSGFLSTEEIRNLRELGAAIGAEPLHYQCPVISPFRKGPCNCGALE